MNDKAQQQSAINTQVRQAIVTGLKMLGSEDICTPNAWNKDLTVLDQILQDLAMGRLMITDGPKAEIEKKSEESSKSGEGKGE